MSATPRKRARDATLLLSDEGTELSDWTPAATPGSGVLVPFPERPPPPSAAPPSSVQSNASFVFASAASALVYAFSPSPAVGARKRRARSPPRPSPSPSPGVLVPFPRRSPRRSPGRVSSSTSSTRAAAAEEQPEETALMCEQWLELCGVVRESGRYAELCAAPAPPADVAEQIDLDLKRCDELGSGDDKEARREALRRVLLAFCRHDPQTGYVQGMDSVAAAALMASDPAVGEAAEEAAFWWLSHVTRSVLPDFYTAGMPGLWAELGAISRALSVVRPRLAAHLESLGCDLTIFGPAWYLTLFQRILPLEETRAVCAALAARRVAPTHVALGVVVASEKVLLGAMSFDDAVHALCGDICNRRRAPRGVLKCARDAAAQLPPAKLAAIHDAERKALGMPATPAASDASDTRPPAKRRRST